MASSHLCKRLFTTKAAVNLSQGRPHSVMVCILQTVLAAPKSSSVAPAAAVHRAASVAADDRNVAAAPLPPLRRSQSAGGAKETAERRVPPAAERRVSPAVQRRVSPAVQRRMSLAVQRRVSPAAQRRVPSLPSWPSRSTDSSVSWGPAVRTVGLAPACAPSHLYQTAPTCHSYGTRNVSVSRVPTR